MMTPDPRLSERRSREPNCSSSPKKYRKKGSLGNGELRVRTTCRDEMFATPLTACPAIRVKSGPPPTNAAPADPGTDGARGSREAACGSAARESEDVRIRPVTTR